MCLNAPGISGELRFVVLRLFKHVQDNFRKRFFDGFAIDPGTVLRCDGTSSRAANNHELSATFLCFPYLSVGSRSQNSQSATHDYPTRSIMRILYPYESTEDRETAPSFCKSTPHASESVLYVPQLWAVIIGSSKHFKASFQFSNSILRQYIEYVVTCADLGSNDLFGSSVSVVQALNSKDHIPVIPEDWLLRTDRASIISRHTFDEKHTSSEQDKQQDQFANVTMSHNDQNLIDNENSTSVQLFDGMPVEAFLVKDNEHVTSTLSSMPSSRLEDPEKSQINETRQKLRYQFPSVQDANDSGDEVIPEHDGMSSVSSIKIERQVLELNAHISDSSPLNGIEPIEATEKVSTENELTEERNSILSMLSSLTEPQMNTQYLEAFQTCLNYILHIWTKSSYNKEREQLGILTKLEQSIPRAEMLRSMCDLELQGSVFAQHLEYRDAMLRALGVKNSSCQNELRSLGEAVKEAIRLLSTIPGSDLSMVIGPPSKRVFGQVDLLQTTEQSMDKTSPTKHNLRRRSTPPFLTWAWLSSEFDKSVRPERLAAENLFAIMEDIDRNLRHRNEISYTLAMEISLAEWDERMTGSQQQLSHFPSERPGDCHLGVPTYSRPHVLSDPPSTPRRSIVDLLGDDALLQTQKSAIHAAIDDLSSHAKNFVGLFIPCSYQHAVSKKIWGSLSLLLKVSTDLNLHIINFPQLY